MQDMFYEEETQEEESIDFARYFRVVIKRKWLILTICILVTIPWLFYLKSLPPSYEASCTIEFSNLEGGEGNLINQSMLIKLMSRKFAERVVGQLGLTLCLDMKKSGFKRYQLFEEFSTTLNPKSGTYIIRSDDNNMYSIFYKDVKNDIEKIIHTGYLDDAKYQLQETDAGFSFRFPDDIAMFTDDIEFSIAKFRKAVESFRKITDVSFAGPNILKLTMTDSDPVLVAKMVNRLAQIYVDENKEIRETSIENQKTIIEEKLRFAREKLAESERKLKDFMSKNVISLTDQTKKRGNELNEAENDLEKFNSDINDLNELLGKLDLKDNSDEEIERLKYVYQQLTRLPTFDTNYKMGALRSELADKEDQYAAFIKGGLTKKHRKTIELENEIAELQGEIKAEALSHRKEIRSKIYRVKQKINSLKKNLTDDLTDDQIQQMVLQRDYDDNAAIVRDLNSEYARIDLTESVETVSIDILDKAIAPEYPVNRTKKKKAMLGGVFALFLGFGVAFGLEFLDKSIKTVDDVKKYLKLDVLGTIPNLDFKDIGEHQDAEKMKMIDQQLVTYDYSPTPIGEAYRSLRTNLVFSKKAGRIQSFVITSTAPGDGKSFTAANLAISIAQHKSNTLIIDADLRRGVLHNTFGVPKEPGFTNYLTKTATFSQVINETLIPNLSLISCGSLLPNPSELLGSPQMARFLDEAKRKFDIIIFDSPPLNAATDAIVIGTQVDRAVIVIRSGITNRNIAKQKLELFKNVPAKVLGVILNGTTADFGHDGYSYYHY